MRKFILLCFLLTLYSSAHIALAQEAPRIKKDPQFDLDLAAASYLYAVDMVVGLTSDQANKVRELTKKKTSADQFDLFIIHLTCIGDPFNSQPLRLIEGLEAVLTPEQKLYLETYNKWKPRNRIEGLTEAQHNANLREQIRCAEELKFRQLIQELKLPENKSKKLQFLSKKMINERVNQQVTARERSNRFLSALAKVPQGTTLTSAFQPGGALENFTNDDFKEFLKFNELVGKHPTVASRPDDSDSDKLVKKILDEDEKSRLARFRKERNARHARYMAHVLVADWTSELDLDPKQRVALMELFARNLKPPFWPGLPRVKRLEKLQGLKAIPEQKYAAIVGQENLDVLLKQINISLR